MRRECPLQNVFLGLNFVTYIYSGNENKWHLSGDNNDSQSILHDIKVMPSRTFSLMAAGFQYNKINRFKPQKSVMVQICSTNLWQLSQGVYLFTVCLQRQCMVVAFKWDDCKLYKTWYKAFFFSAPEKTENRRKTFQLSVFCINITLLSLLRQCWRAAPWHHFQMFRMSIMFSVTGLPVELVLLRAMVQMFST